MYAECIHYLMGKMPAGLKRYWASRRRAKKKGGKSMARRKGSRRGGVRRAFGRAYRSYSRKKVSITSVAALGWLGLRLYEAAKPHTGDPSQMAKSVAYQFTGYDADAKKMDWSIVAMTWGVPVGLKVGKRIAGMTRLNLFEGTPVRM